MKRLGICIAGLNGAVASTMVAGVALMRRRLATPVAMLAESYLESHKLAGFESFAFAGWDTREEDCLAAALRNRVVEPPRLQPVSKELAAIKPWRPSVRNLARDIEGFRRKHKLESVVVLNLLPTGLHAETGHFASAAAKTGSAFINFTPNLGGEEQLSTIPYCGRDGKTGQTWLKSVLAPAFRARELRITGWYSTNLLGNEDGRVVG
jgi:myo-inositol-1-phosphate synthase